jgi:hypothetical protein
VRIWSSGTDMISGSSLDQAFNAKHLWRGASTPSRRR